MQPHVHLVGDIAEIAATARGTAVVHLEVLDDALVVDLDALGVLPADIQDGARIRVHHVRAQPVAEDLGADVLLREGQRHPAIAGADGVGLLQLDRHGPVDAAGHLGGVVVRPDHPVQRPIELFAETAGGWPVLDRDDRLVVDVQQHVIGQPGVARDLLGDRQITRARIVAEEVGFPLGPWREHRRRLVAQPAEDLAQRRPDAVAQLLEALALDLGEAGLFEIAELLDELLQPEGILEPREELLDLRIAAFLGAELAAEEGEAGVDIGLLAGDAARGLVVRARVGDAAAKHAFVLVQQDRLGGGRAEVDSDEGPHAARPLPARFCSIICR